MSMGKTIAKAAGVILVMNLSTKLLGFVRDLLVAKNFGATTATDAYLVAYTIPFFLQSILGFALVTAVVPLLTKYLVEDREEEAWRLASSILNITFVALTAISLVFILGARYVVGALAPGFNPDTAALAVNLTRIMIPSLIFMSTGMVITGILNAKYRFAVAAFAPGFSNLIIILTLVFFANQGVHSLAIGTLVGFVGFLLLQIPVLFKTGFKYSFTFDLQHPDIKKIMWQIGPIVLGVAVNQVYFALNRVFASGMPEGSIAALDFGNKLMNLPLGVFVAAISSAIFPALAAHAVKNQRDKLAQTLIKGLNLVSIITIPAAVGLIVLRTPIVKLLFERGAFTATATVATASALFFFSLSLMPQAANMVITRAYYAVGDVRRPLLMGVYSIAANIIISFIAIRYLAHAGLALANSVAITINTFILYTGLKKHLPFMHTRAFLLELGKILTASAGMGVVTWVCARALVGLQGSKGLVLQVGVSVVVGIIVFMVLVSLLRSETALGLLDDIRKKILKRTK